MRGAAPLLALLLGLVLCLPAGAAEAARSQSPAAAPSRSRLSDGDPLNGGYLIVNMHGMLFHPDARDIDEDVAYARWLGSGVIRVFATDNNGLEAWGGSTVGDRIADIAPSLRAAN